MKKKKKTINDKQKIDNFIAQIKELKINIKKNNKMFCELNKELINFMFKNFRINFIKMT